MKVKLYVRCRYGDLNWFNGDHWQRLTSDDILRCLLSFTEVTSFNSTFNYKDHSWIAVVDIIPLTERMIVRNLQEEFQRLFKKDVDVEVLERKLGKGETKKVITSLMMEKLEK